MKHYRTTNQGLFVLFLVQLNVAASIGYAAFGKETWAWVHFVTALIGLAIVLASFVRSWSR